MATPTGDYLKRTGELEASIFERSGRFFRIQGHWFFKTREGIDYGPFGNRVECRYAFDEFFELVSANEELGGGEVDFEDASGNWQVPDIKFK